MSNLNTAFEHLIKDIYDSETRLLAAMPELRDAAQNPRLKEAISLHMTQTQDQIERIKQIGATCGFEVSGEICQATVGLVKEAQAHVGEFKGTIAGDAVIISAAQKNEHYEIANYGCAVTWAELLGKDECATLLEKSLQEEEETDDILSSLAESEVNRAALGQSDANASFAGSTSTAMGSGSAFSQDQVKVL